MIIALNAKYNAIKFSNFFLNARKVISNQTRPGADRLECRDALLVMTRYFKGKTGTTGREGQLFICSIPDR